MDRREVAYFVHNLNDAAVARRIAMLRSAGAHVRVAGFHRGELPADMGQSLGRTRDARLGHRALAVVRNLVMRRRAARVAAGAALVIARSLEMLAIAAPCLRPGQRLVYECLDIHRLMLGAGPVSIALRTLERRLLARVAVVIVSSPRFRDDYFCACQGFAGEILLVENKVCGDTQGADPPPPAPAGPPWRIGWFGMLRCRRSFAILRALAAASGGAVEVVIAGRPSQAEWPDFAADAAAAPGVTFLGSYRPDRLAELYAQVHFVWAIDFFEEGLNSAWLLPNRLYEGLANGAVPLALRRVETGAWLGRHGVGCLFDTVEDGLAPFFAGMTTDRYDALRRDVVALPREAVVRDTAERDAIVATLAGLA